MRILRNRVNETIVLAVAATALGASNAAALHLWGPGGRGHEPSASEAAEPPSASPPHQAMAPAPADTMQPSNSMAAVHSPPAASAPGNAAGAIIEDEVPTPHRGTAEASAPTSMTAPPSGAMPPTAVAVAPAKPKRRSTSADAQRAATDKASEEIRQEQIRRLSSATATTAANAKVKSSPGAAGDAPVPSVVAGD